MLGVTAFAMSAIGMFVGGRFGMRFGRIAGIAGGIMLIALGIFSAIQGELL
jgi:putative Mn2+ efflux pump MntP